MSALLYLPHSSSKSWEEASAATGGSSRTSTPRRSGFCKFLGLRNFSLQCAPWSLPYLCLLGMTVASLASQEKQVTIWEMSVLLWISSLSLFRLGAGQLSYGHNKVFNFTVEQHAENGVWFICFTFTCWVKWNPKSMETGNYLNNKLSIM